VNDAAVARISPRAWVVVLGAAIGLAAVYVLATPHTADLAAQTARADLFHRNGFVAYWSSWYAGTSAASYSLLTPPLLGWFGPVWLGAISVVVSGALAVPLLREARRPVLGAAAVTLVAFLDVESGRTTFAVGLALGLAALLANERRRPLLAGTLALLVTAASPVAGVLLAVIAAGTVLAGPRRRWAALNVLGGVGIGLVAIAILSRGTASGYEPLTRTSFLIAVLTALVVIVSPVGRRVRTVGWLAIVVLIACYFVHSAIGANATRLCVLGALPAVVAAARWPKPLLVLAVIAAGFLPFSQLHNDLSAAGGPEASRSFVAPLRSTIAAMGDQKDRLELVDTRTHWPATYLLPTVTLARGWERQIDESTNPMFYGRAPLTAATYRAFLDRNAVSLVAVPQGVPLDYGATAEAALIARGLPYLSEAWRNSHWVLYYVLRQTQLVTAPCQVISQAHNEVNLISDFPGRCLVRMNWSPYLTVAGARISKAANGQVRLTVSHGGSYRIHAEWRWP
jgi:hypothetical protein